MLNQVQLIGHLGADVETRSFQNGGRVANLRLAVTDKWKDRNGERKERTEWVSVAIFNEGLVGVAEKYLRKGSKVFVQGKFMTRKWQAQDGSDRYTTECVLQGPVATLVLLDGPQGERKRGQDDRPGEFGDHRGSGSSQSPADLEDEIPF